jgi:hypothetical protein
MGQTPSVTPPSSLSTIAKNNTRTMSAGDWVRLQRLRGARSYAPSNPLIEPTPDLVDNTDIAPKPAPQLSYSPGMGVFKVVGTSKTRRTASQWSDFVASQRADFVTTSQAATTGVAVTETVTKVCNCSSDPMPMKDITCKRCVGLTMHTASPCLPPTITNISSDEPFDGPWHITWTEANVLSRSIVVEKNGDTYPGSITEYHAGGCTFTDPNDGSGSYTITVTVTGCNGQTASAVQQISVPCFLGNVLLETKDGPVKVENITVGTEMLQPDGTYSRVVDTTKTTIMNDFGNSSRLYADESEKCIVTWWHKLRFGDETEELRAGEHSRMHRVHREYPFDVFHLKLEHPTTDKLLVHGTDIVTEGFVRPEPTS